MGANDREYFTLHEAEALHGKRFRATAGYSGVPAGTVGVVCGLYSASGLATEDRQFNPCGVYVVWPDLPPQNLLDRHYGGRVDGFSKRDLELTFTGGPHKGQRAMVPVEMKAEEFFT